MQFNAIIALAIATFSAAPALAEQVSAPNEIIFAEANR